MNMQKHLNMIKRWDIIIVIGLMLVSFLPLGIFTYAQAAAGDAQLKAVVSADGDTMAEFVLADDNQVEEYVYIDEQGHENVIVREGLNVYMSEAHCTDQLCVRKGTVDSMGETIVCLPNHVMVEVEPVNEDSDIENDVDIISLAKNAQFKGEEL